MAAWTIEQASTALDGAAEVFDEVGFRPDLVDGPPPARVGVSLRAVLGATLGSSHHD